jgi:hypothetical protein
MKVQQLGGSKLELRSGSEKYSISSMTASNCSRPFLASTRALFVGVGNQLGIESLAMPVLFLDHSSALPATPPLDRLFRG